MHIMRVIMQPLKEPQGAGDQRGALIMKKMIALALTAVMTIGVFTGCSSSGSNGAGTGKALYTVSGNFKNVEIDTVTEGKLTVATSPDFAPMEFVDPTKTGQDMYMGFDVTLAQFIADSLGLELVIMPLDFDACQTAVYTGAVDMSISGFSWTAERAENANLSGYYYAGENESEQVLITLAENEGLYDTAEKLAGAKVAAQNASLQQSLVEEQLPDSKLELFTSLSTGVLQLKNGDFACIAVADGNADAIISNNPELIKSGFEFYVDPSETGNVILLQKGADELTDVVNQILEESESYWDSWYANAEELSGIGIEQSYDENGNAIE